MIVTKVIQAKDQLRRYVRGEMKKGHHVELEYDERTETWLALGWINMETSWPSSIIEDPCPTISVNTLIAEMDELNDALAYYEGCF